MRFTTLTSGTARVKLVGKDSPAGLIAVFQQNRARGSGVNIEVPQCRLAWTLEPKHHAVAGARPIQARAGFARAVAHQL